MLRNEKAYAVIIDTDHEPAGMRILAEIKTEDQARVLIHKAERDVKTN